MAEEKPTGESTGGSSITELLKSAAAKLGPLVVSAVVSVGFVAFAGKAVLWTRFTALQVPGDQVVKVVPQSEAVATGASMLLIFGLLGVLAAVGVYLIDRPGRATPGMSRGLLVILAVEGIVAIWLAEGKSATAQIVASEVLLFAVGVILWATFVGDLIERDKKVPDFKTGEAEQDPPPRPLFRASEKSGITRLGLSVAVVLAAVLGGLAYAATTLVFGKSDDIAWIVAVPFLAAGLLGALRWHVSRFDPAAETAAWNARKEIKAQEKAEAKQDLEDEERRQRQEQRRKAAEEKAAVRQEEGWRDRLAAFWKALWAWRRDRSTVTVNVGSDASGAAPSDGKPVGPKGDDNDPVPQKPPGFTLKPLGFAVTIVFAAVAIALPAAVLHEWWLIVALAAVTVLGAGLWRIAELSGARFVWYGLAVFLSVPLFGTVLLIARNVDEPQVQPMAMIRSTDGPDEAIQGLYVTETSDRVYFANVATEGCEEKVTPHSGRLLWVPKEEVVAMEVGPLQNVKQAGHSALEMSYDLTPGIETVGATIELPKAAAAESPEPAISAPPKSPEAEAGGGAAGEGSESEEDKGAEAKEEKEPEETSGSFDTRLKNVGPAVRPNFGTGLRIEPETVSPGGEATLRMSQENVDVEGFGPSRSGHNLRLGGRVVDISKEPAGAAEGAEYIELENGRLIALAKGGAYVKEGPAEFVPEDGADADADDSGGEGTFVRLDDPAVLEFKGEEGSDGFEYVEVEERTGEGAVVTGGATVTLAGGTFEGRPWEEEEVELKDQPLLRQAWHRDHIRFHVPDDARTGVVTVECDQLAGAPLLQVSHTPTARIAVKVPPKKSVLTFNSKPSTAGLPAHGAGEGGGSSSSGKKAQKLLTRRWRVDGVQQGHGKVVHARMTPRMTPYTVELTVTDREGSSDTAKLQVLRLPAAALKSAKKIHSTLKTAREGIEEVVENERPTAVELDGYTDSPGKVDNNVWASLKKDDLVRKRLMHEAKKPAEGERPIAVEELGHGESCPLRPRSSPADLHVDLFLLHAGVTVRPVKSCHALGRKSALWHPPPKEGGGED